MMTIPVVENDFAPAFFLNRFGGGAVGYLLKTAEGDSLVAAILGAMEGESVIAPEMTFPKPPQPFVCAGVCVAAGTAACCASSGAT